MIITSFQKALIVAILSFIISGCLKLPPKIEDQFSAPWRKPETSDLALIAPILFKNSVGGCSHFYLRNSKSSETEFLVACTDNFVNWSYYITQTKTEEVILVGEKIEPPSLD